MQTLQTPPHTHFAAAVASAPPRRQEDAMNPKFSVTRKTYYALGLLAAAFSLAGAFGVLFGQPFTLLDNLAFILTGMMFLLLAAIKGSPKQQKARYFACFFLMILSIGRLPVLAGRLLAASYWPAFLWIETLRTPHGPGLRFAARTLTLCEGLGCILWAAVALGGLEGFAFVANILWLLTALTRGWAALGLYKAAAAAGGD